MVLRPQKQEKAQEGRGAPRTVRGEGERTRKRGACCKLARGAIRLQGPSFNLLSLATSLPRPAGHGGSQFRQITPDTLIQIQTQLRQVGKAGSNFQKTDRVNVYTPTRAPYLLPHQGS